MSESIQLVVCGAGGRMGQAVLRLAAGYLDLTVVAALIRPGSEITSGVLKLHSNIAFGPVLTADAEADVLIDFSGTQGFNTALAVAVERKLAFVSGSTGLTDSQHAAMDAATLDIPILWTANFSFGVAALAHLVEQAARWLPDWDCEIIEAHHRHKQDAPSGTALMLGRRVSQARGTTLDDVTIDRRGARQSGAIGYAVVRGGDTVGEHEVRLLGPGERIELIHRATDRDTFARGALTAARWLAGQAPGLYTMADVLGLEN